MRQLEKLIQYEFNEISWLSKAMEAIRVEVPGEGANHKEYTNEGLATVGDAILKFVIADKLYREGKKEKGVITSEKSKIENNECMYKLANEMIIDGKRIIDFAYNDKHFYIDDCLDHEKVANSNHSPYVEAIIGAVYYDSNFENTKKWILEWLLPKLKKYN